MAEEGSGGEVESAAPVHEVLLISAGASHSVALLCEFQNLCFYCRMCGWVLSAPDYLDTGSQHFRSIDRTASIFKHVYGLAMSGSSECFFDFVVLLDAITIRKNPLVLARKCCSILADYYL